MVRAGWRGGKVVVVAVRDSARLREAASGDKLDSPSQTTTFIWTLPI
jgi:hypothetical protein